jgi:hypothetical protein
MGVFSIEFDSVPFGQEVTISKDLSGAGARGSIELSILIH